MSARARGFESHSLRWTSKRLADDNIIFTDVQASGLCRSTQEAEGTPLERVQVVNSGARVQIPPSPLAVVKSQKNLKKVVDKQKWL